MHKLYALSMLYNIRNSKSKNKPELNIYKEIIEQVNHLSFLGILINDKYNWNYHINYIRAKLSRSIAIINKIKNKLPLINRMQILGYFYTYNIFESHLNYCSSICGSTFLYIIQPITILQNMVIQFFFLF